MRNAIEHESLGRLPESHAFIESFGILLCFNIYDCRTEMFNGSIYGMKHDLLAIAFVSFCRDDPADGDFFHVSTCRTYTSQGNDFTLYGQPQMNGFLVIAVQILIDAVLFNHKDLATHSEEFV